MLQLPTKYIWNKTLSNEWLKLSQENDHGVVSTDTIEYIEPSQVPTGRKVTYVRFVCANWPLKTEPWKLKLLIVGDKLPYESDICAPASNLIETKILFNSTISDAYKGANFFICDLKGFFLASPMVYPDYMRVPLKHFPEYITRKYNLRKYNGCKSKFICQDQEGNIRVKASSHSGIRATIRKITVSRIYAYHFKHRNSETCNKEKIFCLYLDDLWVKYFSDSDAKHFLQTLGKCYQYTVDWSGRNYCEFTFDWNHIDM